MKFGQLVLRKIIEIDATRCEILRLKCTKFDFGWGLQRSPDPYLNLRGPTSKGGEGRNSDLFHWSILKYIVVIVMTVY